MHRLGRVHVEQTDGGTAWVLHTENVRRFALTADPRSLAVATVTLDGQTDLPVVRTPLAHYCRLGTTDERPWTVCDGDAGGPWTQTERSPSSSGPVLQVWDRPVLVVVGTAAPSETVDAYEEAASLLASDYHHYSLGKAPILTDVDALARDDLAAYNLILLGGPLNNQVTATLRSGLPGPFPRVLAIATLAFGAPPPRVSRPLHRDRHCCAPGLRHGSGL